MFARSSAQSVAAADGFHVVRVQKNAGVVSVRVLFGSKFGCLFYKERLNMEYKFKIGDILQHRLTGDRVIIIKKVQGDSPQYKARLRDYIIMEFCEEELTFEEV